MGEVLYAYYLILAKAGNKQQQIAQVLGWSPTPVRIPDRLVDGLQSEFIGLGTGLVHMPFQVGTVIETVEQWKELESGEREHMLQDPWEFKNFLFTRHFSSQLLVNNQNTGRIEKEILLHIVFPDSFETIGTNAKRRIANDKRFAGFVTEEIDDVDRKILQIRQGLEAKLGRDFNFYDPDIRQWQPTLPPNDNPWDEYVERAREYVGTGKLESEEIEYKVGIGGKLAEAREAVLAGADGWGSLVRNAIVSHQNNLVYRVELVRFRDWVDDSPHEALNALEALWTPDDSSVTDRVTGFCNLFPRSVTGGAGTRMTTVSVLLMGLDVRAVPAV